MTKIKIALTVVAGLLLSGCSSTPPELVKGRDFDTNYSHAYNIANQTALTRNNSPLRDFTEMEISKAKTDLHSYSKGADRSLMIGALFIATGNLTGVIDVAGGAAGHLASSDHIAAQPRWIVTVPTTKFNSEEEAQKYIFNTITTVTKDYLSEFGEVKSELAESMGKVRQHAKSTYLYSKDERIDVGLYHEENSLNGLKVVKYRTGLSENLVYAYGLDEMASYDSHSLIATFNPILLMKSGITDKTYSELMIGITKKMPKGFYLYTPSFPKQYDYDEDKGLIYYVDYNQVVPAIYTQGQKFEFIKP